MRVGYGNPKNRTLTPDVVFDLVQHHPQGGDVIDSALLMIGN
jgi:hypothetical protein